MNQALTKGQSIPAPAKVKKWNNRLAVVIPARFAKAHNIKVGTILDLENVGVIPKKRRRYKMSELMAKFKPEHRHGEWNVGDPVSKEVW